MSTPDTTSLHPAVVVDSRDEGSLRGVRVTRPDLHANIATMSAYRHPGQFVVLSPEAHVEGAFFAIVNPPSLDATHVELLVKPEGPVAAALAAVSSGDTVWMSEPLGAGFANPRPRAGRVIAFAAGSGIAAIRSMIDAIVARPARLTRIDLFYGQRTDTDFAYRRWLDELAGRGVHVHLVTSRSRGRQALSGYVQQAADSDPIFEAPEETFVYVAGMEPMVDAVRELCRRRGVPSAQVSTNL